MGRASRRKKVKKFPIPAKISKGFSPLLKPNDILWDDTSWDWDEPYNPIEDNAFLGLIRIPEKPAVSVPDNELYAAFVCDGEIEGESVWLRVFEGGLDDCISCLATIINLKEDENLREQKLGLEPNEWATKRKAFFQTIRQNCLEQGQAKEDFYWLIQKTNHSPIRFRLNHLGD